MPSEELLRAWFADAMRNVCIHTADMILFDLDDPTKVDLVLNECGDTPHKLRTPRGGIHLGYRRRKGLKLSNAVDVKGQQIDIRTNGGLEMIPPSVTPDGAYEWIGEGLRPVKDLPYGNVGFIRTRVKRRIQTTIDEQCDGGRILYRGRLYVDRFEQHAVSGEGGHKQAFVAALKIVSFVRRLGGSENDAWELLLYFNATKCRPAWDLSIPSEEKALRHKLEEALRLAK